MTTEYYMSVALKKITESPDVARKNCAFVGNQQKRSFLQSEKTLTPHHNFLQLNQTKCPYCYTTELCSSSPQFVPVCSSTVSCREAELGVQDYNSKLS